MKIPKLISSFFSSRFNIVLVIILILLGTLAFINTSEPTTNSITNETAAVHFFYLPTCPHCAEQKPIYFEVKQNRTDIPFYEHDASSKEGSELFYKMATEAGLDTSNLRVPTIFVGKKPLVGVHSKEEIMSAIDECLEACKKGGSNSQITQEVKTSFSDFELPFLGRTDLNKWSLPTLAIVLGLIDGFNPCAMWVLVYLISLLVEVHDRKRIWLIVGSFVLASGILYFLFMTAWLNIFLFIGYIRILTIIIGLVALGGGILNIKDYITTKGDLTCKVVDEKGQEKTIKRIEKIISQPVSIAIILSVIGLAFVVNSVEFVCSAAIPAVFTQILTLSGISSLYHYLYILLYVFFFMLDDVIIFGMAAFAIGSSFGEKYAKYSKIIGGAILIILGIIMLFAPQLLR